MTQAPMPSPSPMNASGCLVRLFWMLVGPLVLLGAAYSIMTHRSSFPSRADLIFWIAVLAVTLLRYVDIRFLSGRTSAGRPASMQDFRRYAVFLASASMALWIVAHVLAWLL